MCISTGRPCSRADANKVLQFEDAFMEALLPMVQNDPKRGAFINSCMGHVVSPAKIDGKSPWQAFDVWRAQSDAKRVWVDLCEGSQEPCDSHCPLLKVVKGKT